MKAVLLKGFGGIDKLEFSDSFKAPKPSYGQALVRVMAVSINHLDIWVRKGALAIKPELPHILGSDISGVVERIEYDTDDFKEGDEVVIIPSLSCGMCERCQGGEDNLCAKYDIIGLRSKGGYAEYISVPVRNLIRKPDNLSFEEASTYPLTFLTSWNALVNKGNIKPGDAVFIWAGSSGIGTASIQIAKLFNAFVITSAGHEEKMEKCKDLGADIVINHYKQDVEREVRKIFPEGIDIVIDHVGEKTIKKSASLLRKGGVLVFLGTTTGSNMLLDIRYLFVREISLKGVYMGRRSDLFRITDLFKNGKFKPIIDSIYDIREVGTAHRKLENSEHFGKIVLRVP